jgi:hypothetical protein
MSLGSWSKEVWECELMHVDDPGISAMNYRTGGGSGLAVFHLKPKPGMF